MTLKQELTKLTAGALASETVLREFRFRLAEGKLTRDENPLTHFCVFFAAFDPNRKLVFLGHHIKADLWLVNGGHIDKGELVGQAVRREMREEWGFTPKAQAMGAPSYLSITKIRFPEKQICQLHYDIWHFVSVDKQKFFPDESKLAEEFHQTRWMTPATAREQITDSNTRLGIDLLETYF